MSKSQIKKHVIETDVNPKLCELVRQLRAKKYRLSFIVKSLACDPARAFIDDKLPKPLTERINATFKQVDIAISEINSGQAKRARIPKATVEHFEELAKQIWQAEKVVTVLKRPNLWRAYPALSIAEFAALSFGLNPISQKELPIAPRGSRANANMKEYQRRLGLLKRATLLSQRHPQALLPPEALHAYNSLPEYLKWVSKYGKFRVSSKMTGHVSRRPTSLSKAAATRFIETLKSARTALEIPPDFKYRKSVLGDFVESYLEIEQDEYLKAIWQPLSKEIAAKEGTTNKKHQKFWPLVKERIEAIHGTTEEGAS